MGWDDAGICEGRDERGGGRGSGGGRSGGSKGVHAELEIHVLFEFEVEVAQE